MQWHKVCLLKIKIINEPFSSFVSISGDFTKTPRISVPCNTLLLSMKQSILYFFDNFLAKISAAVPPPKQIIFLSAFFLVSEIIVEYYKDICTLIQR